MSVKDESLYEKVLAILPGELREQIRRTASGYHMFASKLTDIRLRADKCVSLSIEGRNIILSTILSTNDLSAILRLCCQKSVYAYSESLREGYVTFCGCRVGVVGRAVLEDGVICGVDHISSLVFRMPHFIKGAANEALRVWKYMGGREGLLIYSPPGVGKTTLLRDMAYQLSQGPNAIRVAIVDSRGELGEMGECAHCLLDILSGYPKAEGIEIATRTLSPDVVMCDEIGGFEEADSILSVQSCGVPLVASTHAASFAQVIAKPALRPLL